MQEFDANGLKAPSCSASASHGTSREDGYIESPLSSTPIGCLQNTPSTSQEISSVNESSGNPSPQLNCDHNMPELLVCGSPDAKKSLDFQSSPALRRSPKKHKMPSSLNWSSSSTSPKKRKTEVTCIGHKFYN